MELKDIREQIVKLGADMKAIMAKASEEKRDLNQDEETQFDKMDSDREKLLAAERRQSRMEDLEKGVGRRSEPTLPVAAPKKQAQAAPVSMWEGIRSFLLSSRGKDVTPEQRENARLLGVQLGAKEMTIRMPDQPLESLRHDNISAWETRALSTLNAGSPVDGYYTIQNEMMRPLEEARLAFGGMRQAASVFRTETGALLQWPTDNDTSNKGEILDENTLANEKDVAFGQVNFGAFKYSSKVVRVSVELLQDSTVNLGPYLGRKLGTRIGRIENDHFTTGNGSTQPNGIITAATSSAVQLAAQTPTLAELISIEHTVDPEYRTGPGVAWMFHDTILAEMKKIIDASTGRPIWMPGMVGGAPDTILGYRYYINQSMAVAAASGAGKSILFGDLSKYMIRDVRDITLVVANELYAQYHQVAFFAFARTDGDLLDAGTHPVKYALNKA